MPTPNDSYEPLDVTIPQASGSDPTHICYHEEDFGAIKEQLRKITPLWQYVTIMLLMLGAMTWIWAGWQGAQDQRIAVVASYQEQSQQSAEHDHRILEAIAKKTLGEVPP